MRPDLTLKQKNFLVYLQHEIDRKGSAPSLRKAAADLNISHAAVAQFIRALENKGYLRRDGRYSRTIHLLGRTTNMAAGQRWIEVPVSGKITAGLPMYAQQEHDDTIVVDRDMYRGQNLFALRVKGDSMKDVGILPSDIVICEPRQYAQNGEIVVALINNEEATVKRFFLRKNHIELRPENKAYPSMRYRFGEVLIQGKVIGALRGPLDVL